MKHLFSLLLFIFLTSPSIYGRENLRLELEAEGSPSGRILICYRDYSVKGYPEFFILDEVDKGRHLLDIDQLPAQMSQLSLFCDGYAPQTVRYRDHDGKLLPRVKAHLFLKTYITIRHSENREGRDLVSVPEQTTVLTENTYPTYPDQGGGTSWSLEPSGVFREKPWIKYFVPDNTGQRGAIISDESFDRMKLAPLKGYVARSYPLDEGMKFYMKSGRAYSKMEILNISNERPSNLQIREFYPTIKHMSSVDHEDWKSNPQRYKGTEVSIEVGSVRRTDKAPAKIGFQAYEIHEAKVIKKKSYGQIVTTASCGPINFIYSADLISEQFEADYIAGGEEGTDTDSNEANRNWALPKDMSGILWHLEGEWVLVYKQPS